MSAMFFISTNSALCYTNNIHVCIWILYIYSVFNDNGNIKHFECMTVNLIKVFFTAQQLILHVFKKLKFLKKFFVDAQQIFFEL